MLFRIDFKSGTSIHSQLVNQLKAAAASGALQPGEPLPSIGAVAAELRINRNAVAKAYAELESNGVIESLPGKGYILRDPQSPLRKDTRRKLLIADIDQAIVQAPHASQKTLIYSVLTLVLGALYLGLVGGLGMLMVRAGIVRGEFVAVLATVVVAAVFMPVRTRVQQFVDRVVFAKRYELPRALQLLKAEAPFQPDLDSFIQRVTEKTTTLLTTPVEFVRDYAQLLALVNSIPSLKSARAPIHNGDGLLMPVFSDNELFAVIRLGAKSSRQGFDSEDMNFLAAVADQLGTTAGHFRLRREKQEAEYALDIQRGLLPRDIPQIPGCTIAGAWQPARTVGGDYYDVLKLSETKVGLVVADVSGKGIPASLLMANLQATVKAYATADCSPKELCEKVNRAVSSSITLGKFITFFYAILDSSERRLTYANAGHNPPLITRQDGSCLKLEAGGAVLGVMPQWCYQEGMIQLLPGDRIVICTDGISEAADGNGEEFGEERLAEVVRMNSSLSAPGIRDVVMQTVSAFCSEDFADDATLLMVAVE